MNRKAMRPCAIYRILFVLVVILIAGAASGCKVITPEPPAGSPTAAVTPTAEELAPAEEKSIPVTEKGSAVTQAKTSIQKTHNYPYTIRTDDLRYLPNFARPEGCNWQGVAGQVFDTDGEPMQQVIVNIGWTEGGAAKTNTGMTGNSIAYGPGGYEVDITNKPFTSTHNLWVQIKDLSGQYLSERIYLNTYADCTHNLIVANFRYQGYYELYFPFSAK